MENQKNTNTDSKNKESIKKNVSSFQNYKAKTQSLYSDEINLKNTLGRTDRKYNPSRTKDYETLNSDINTALTELDKTRASEISEALAETSSIYNNIVSYYSNMFYMRYTVLPTLINEEKYEDLSEEEYYNIYKDMLNSVEGINIETIFPAIIYNTVLLGSVFIYVEKNTSSKTLTTLILPRSYCKNSLQTQFGNNMVMFNFSYFDELIQSFNKNPDSLNITAEEIMKFFPKEFQSKYNAYKQNKTSLKWQLLDARKSTSFSLNKSGMPGRLDSAFSIIDFEKFKEIELERSKEELEKILVHQIPLNSNGDLVFDIDEALDIDRTMRSALKGAKNLKLLTVFGPTELLELQKQRDKDIALSENALKNIYASAGLNYNLFTGDQDSLMISIKRDKALIQNLLQNISLFYNICLNNSYSWKPYQVQIDVLPITIYDEVDMIKQYIENAGVGIGRLQAVVATGIKQKNISDLAKIEKLLKLDEILIPLHSMHTSTDKTNTETKEEEEEVTTIKETNKI